MPVDVAIDDIHDTEWTGNGDLRTVTGPDAVRQMIYVAVRESVDLRVPGLTPSIIEDTRSDIEAAVRASEHTREPIRVVVDDVDHDEGVVTFAVSTARTETVLESE